MTATSDARTTAAPGKSPVARRAKKARTKKNGHLPTQIFLAVVAVLWIFPVGYALINSFRDYAYTSTHGYLSFGGFTLQNYRDAWEQANFSHTMLNSAIITIPAVLLTLFLTCCIAFVVARFSFKFNLALLATFTAANLLPPQALLIPVYRMFRAIEVPFWFSESGTLLNSYWATHRGQHRLPDRVLRLRAEQLHEDAAARDLRVGRGRRRRGARASSSADPAAVPAAAGGPRHSEVTWIYNEFFWATVLLPTGDKYPVTSSLNNLRGQFFTDNNLRRGRLGHGRPADADRLLRAAEAVRRPGLTLGCHQGMSPTRAAASCGPPGPRSSCAHGGAGLPRVLHWGADLPDDARGRPRAASPRGPVPHSALDEPGRSTVLPTAGRRLARHPRVCRRTAPAGRAAPRLGGHVDAASDGDRGRWRDGIRRGRRARRCATGSTTTACCASTPSVTNTCRRRPRPRPGRAARAAAAAAARRRGARPHRPVVPRALARSAPPSPTAPSCAPAAAGAPATTPPCCWPSAPPGFGFRSRRGVGGARRLERQPRAPRRAAARGRRRARRGARRRRAARGRARCASAPGETYTAPDGRASSHSADGLDGLSRRAAPQPAGPRRAPAHAPARSCSTRGRRSTSTTTSTG